jgi:hypothetical protein
VLEVLWLDGLAYRVKEGFLARSMVASSEAFLPLRSRSDIFDEGYHPSTMVYAGHLIPSKVTF